MIDHGFDESVVAERRVTEIIFLIFCFAFPHQIPGLHIQHFQYFCQPISGWRGSKILRHTGLDTFFLQKGKGLTGFAAAGIMKDFNGHSLFYSGQIMTSLYCGLLFNAVLAFIPASDRQVWHDA